MEEKKLEEGITGTATQTVTKELTAQAQGSGYLSVYATPAMIALMEKTACESVAPALKEGCTSVGTQINIKHLAASPVGAKITCQSTLIQADERRLVFDVKAFDESGLIGEGTHERFIVDSKKFQEKADAKITPS